MTLVITSRFDMHVTRSHTRKERCGVEAKMFLFHLQ